MDNEYTFYWYDGTREVLRGSTKAAALNNAGYGHGALGALDRICEGDDDNYIFSKEQHKWIHK
jgi:hypothetical protein